MLYNVPRSSLINTNDVVIFAIILSDIITHVAIRQSTGTYTQDEHKNKYNIYYD